MSRAAERKALILQVATELMGRQGYEATTIAEVAKAAGSSVGSVTNFFVSKAHLGLAARDSVAMDLAQVVGTALKKNALEVRGAAEGAIAAYLAWWAGNPTRAGLLQELAVIRVEGRRMEDAVVVRLSAVVAQWATPQVEAGHLPELDPALFPSLILGPVMMLTTSWTDRLTDPDGSELAQHLARHVCTSLWPASASAGSATTRRKGKQQRGSTGAALARPASDQQLSLAIL